MENRRLRPLFRFLCLLPILISGASGAAVISTFRVDPESRGFKSAMELYRKGRFPESARIFVWLARSHPERALYWYNLGNAYMREGSFDAAIQAYWKARSLRSPLAIPSTLYSALCYRKLRRDDLALGLLYSMRGLQMPAMLAGQRDLEIAEIQMGRGIQFYQSGRYNPALRFFIEAQKLKPSDESEMMIGMSYLKLRNPARARAAFVQVLHDSSDPSRRRDAEEFLLQIRNGLWNPAMPLFLSLDFSGGYNSNVFVNGDIDGVASKAVMDTVAALGYGLELNRHFSLRPEYLLSWEEVISSPDLRLVTQLAQARLVYHSRDWAFGILPRAIYQNLGMQSFLFKPGIELRGEKRLRSQQIGVTYHFQKIDSLDPDYDYLAGRFHQLRAYWTLNQVNYDLNVSALYFTEDIGDEPLNGGILPLANQSFGPELSAFWYPNARWALQASASYLFRKYRNAEQPDGIERLDNQLATGVRVVRRIKNDLTAYLGADDILNASTLDLNSIEDKNYNQLILRLGLSWDPLP